MESADLTPEQAEALRRRASEMLRYTVRLRQRMERLCFPHEDPLFRATVDAFHALQHLHIQAHYLTCSSGVARHSSKRGRHDVR